MLRAPDRSSSPFPLGPREKCLTLLSLALFCIVCFLGGVVVCYAQSPRKYKSISEFSNTMSETAQGRLFFVLMTMTGVFVLFSWVECHLGHVPCCAAVCPDAASFDGVLDIHDGSVRRRPSATPRANVVVNCVVAVSAWGVGCLAYGRFGAAFNAVHLLCAFGVFIFHPIIELLRCVPGGADAKARILRGPRIALSVTAFGLFAGFLVAAHVDHSDASFWCEYALSWALWAELCCCWRVVQVGWHAGEDGNGGGGDEVASVAASEGLYSLVASR